MVLLGRNRLASAGVPCEVRARHWPVCTRLLLSFSAELKLHLVVEIHFSRLKIIIVLLQIFTGFIPIRL
jgi:hypothetical protein